MTSDSAFQEIVRQLDECYDNIVALASSMSEAEWATQSLCPDWDSRGVIVHLAAVEDMLLGWRPQAADESLPFARIGEFVAESEAWENEDLAERCQHVFASRRNELAEFTDEQWAQPCPTPVGPATYQDFMNVRIFDFWMHERDIAVPLSRPTADGTIAAGTSLDQVHGSLGYIVGKRIGLPDGMSIQFEIDGPVSRQMNVVVVGRAAVVEQLDDPDVVVSADLVTFMQLACGRIDPANAIDAGRITWTGDDRWGRQAATSLRFTM